MTGKQQQTLAFPGTLGVQVIETKVRDSPIDSVVVYQDRAEVKRRLSVHLATGENELIISDLTDCVDQNSVRWVSCFCDCKKLELGSEVVV